MAVKTTLKMQFSAGAGDEKKSRTLSLDAPKDDLTETTVKAWMNQAVTKQALMIGTLVADKAVQAYKETVEKTVIFDGSEAAA